MSLWRADLWVSYDANIKFVFWNWLNNGFLFFFFEGLRKGFHVKFFWLLLVGLSMGQVSLGLGLTCTQPDWVRSLENWPALNRNMGWTRRVGSLVGTGQIQRFNGFGPHSRTNLYIFMDLIFLGLFWPKLLGFLNYKDLKFFESCHIILGLFFTSFLLKWPSSSTWICPN